MNFLSGSCFENVIPKLDLKTRSKSVITKHDFMILFIFLFLFLQFVHRIVEYNETRIKRPFGPQMRGRFAAGLLYVMRYAQVPYI